MHRYSEVEVRGELTGTFWWPTGEPWTKELGRTFAVTREPIHTEREISSLREAFERICNDGDSQSAPLVDPASDVIFRRVSFDGTRRLVRERFYLASDLRSVADYVGPVAS